MRTWAQWTGVLAMVAALCAVSSSAWAVGAQINIDGRPIDEKDEPPPPPPPEAAPEVIPNHRELMREIVVGLSEYARARAAGFIVLTRGGEDLFVKGRREFNIEEITDPDGLEKFRRQPLGAVMRRYTRAVGGLVLDDTFCGAPIAEAEARAAAAARKRAEADAKAAAEAKAKEKARTVGRRRGRGAPLGEDVVPEPQPPQQVNSLLLELEARKADEARRKAELEATAHDRLIATIRDQGVPLLSIEHCRSADEARRAMVHAGRTGTLTHAAADPSRRLATIERGRPWNEDSANVPTLRQARNMMVVLDARAFATREEFALAVGDTNHDVLIVDGFYKGNEALTRAEVRQLKFKRLGARRLVLARLNVGEAADGRHYWQKDWRVGAPVWLDAPSPDTPGVAVVRYWHPEWKAIVGDTFKGLMDLGFDGIMLEGVDTFRHFEALTPLE